VEKTSLQTQMYFRQSLVSAEDNVCEPQPGNDFCDVMTFVSPWPIRFHDRMKLECSSQQIARAVVLGLLELNCDRFKIPTSQKSFPGSGSQMLFFGGDKPQLEICLCSQARKKLTNYAQIFGGGKMGKNVSIMRKTHWIKQKFQQLTKLIIKPFQCTEQQ